MVSSCHSGSLFWSSWAPLGVVFGRSVGRFGAFSAFQLIDSTHQLIKSSIQPINSSTHRFNSSTHQLIDSTHQPINSIPKVDELSTTRPDGLRAARLNTARELASSPACWMTAILPLLPNCHTRRGARIPQGLPPTPPDFSPKSIQNRPQIRSKN